MKFVESARRARRVLNIENKADGLWRAGTEPRRPIVWSRHAPSRVYVLELPPVGRSVRAGLELHKSDFPDRRVDDGNELACSIVRAIPKDF